MAHLHYLTVQDLLWINLQTTKKVQHFNYARLEEAASYQYAYGDSHEIGSQATRFLVGFLKLHPFDAGNESTALIGCGAFLHLNGFRFALADEDAMVWLDNLLTKQVRAAEAVGSLIEAKGEHHAPLQPDVRKTIKSQIDRYAQTVATLASRGSTTK